MLNVKKTGCAVGLALGGWHLLWSILVAVGVAQTVLDFVFWAHFIVPIYKVEPFAVMRAVVLVVVTVIVGYLIGAVFASVWNRLSR